MVGPIDDALVEVSWPKDRQRWAAALREFPVMRRLRVSWLVAAAMSAVLLAGSVVIRARGGVRVGPVRITDDGSWSSSVAVALLPVAVVGVLAFCIRRSLLASVTDGTMTWRLSDEGIRLEGETAVEYPWTSVVRWRRAVGHLLIETKPLTRRAVRPGAAAPLSAFDAEQWLATEALLRARVGPEGTLATR